jgi:DNA-binding winged helix-turn-helix (wHTH) protein/tetratricopeptide (TPR) repeat protein
MAVRRFGVFDLDLETGELHRAGRRVHLTAQAAKVLALLASRPGIVVTRDELKRHLWGDDTFVDFDRSLNFCVSLVRTALRDAAHNPRFIETLPRRGYRFIAETVLVDDAVPAPEPVSPADHAVLLRRGRWLLGAAAAVMLVVQQPLPPTAHSRTTALPEARAAFARAFDAAPEDAAALRRSVAALKHATEIDPRFAEAHFALADLYLKLAIRHELPIASALAEAEIAARRAIALEDMPETRQVLANVRLLGAWDWAGARRELARAVTLAPKWDIGLATYARVLSALGDDAAAIATIDRAETVSPTCDLILYDAGAIYARAGRFAEAEDKLRRAIDLGPPRSMTLPEWRAQVHFRRLRHAVARGDWSAAHQAAIAILEANAQPEDVRDRFMRAEPRKAVEAFLRRSAENTTAAAASRYVPPTRLATIFALLDDRDRAIDQLEAAAADRDPDLIYAFRDPEFEHLRGLARFQSLERRIRGSDEPRTSAGKGTN